MFFIDLIIWAWDGINSNSTLTVLAVLAGALLFWRLSIALAPEKICPRCKGKGARSGALGGLKTCRDCKGSGRVPRIGAGAPAENRAPA